MKKMATVKRAYEEIKQERNEYVEGKLMKQIDNDNLTAIIFYLKTQAGWREVHRFEHEGRLELSVDWDSDEGNDQG
jgi:hypothetical protein